jgi:hypothetical protein
MNKHYRILPSLIAILVAMSGCVPSPVRPDNPITVAEVVSEIDKAIVEVEQKALLNLPPFDSADVELETSVAQENGGTFKLIVITLGSKVSRATTQTLSFKLTPPGQMKGLSGEPIHQTLSKAIVAASRELEAALNDKQKRIQLHDLSATIKFEVTRVGEAEIGFDVGSVTLGGSRSNSAGFSHSITLNYVTPEDDLKQEEKNDCERQRECLGPLFDKMMKAPRAK